MKLKRFFIGFVFLVTLACNITSKVPVSTPTSLLPARTPTATLPTTIPAYIPPECVGTPVATLPAATIVAVQRLAQGQTRLFRKVSN